MLIKLPKWVPFVKGEQKLNLPKEAEQLLEDLLKECKTHLKSIREDLIVKAFLLNFEAFKNKNRKSGKGYYTHPAEVALIVASEIPLDDHTVIASLLHDVPTESDSFNLSDIRSEFGSVIADIIEGVSKIRTIEDHNFEQFENYRKLLLSLIKDVRIIIIKLAERLHDMKTLGYLAADKQKRIANETLEIYAPFANRIGMGNIKAQLEDLAFYYLNNKDYTDIAKALELDLEGRKKYIEDFIKPIENKIKNDELLKKHAIKYEINGRAKHIYSIYNKMILREKPMDELYDLYAVRIILDTEDTSFCLIVYNLITELFREVPETFKNYIAYPKNNGYRSLHVAFYGEGNKPVEVQLRTREMHEFAEKGVASHFRYKRGSVPDHSILEREEIEEWMKNLREVFEHIGESEDEQLMEKIRIRLQMDEIYVFTPSDEFRVLPKDASPLDFAYAIHSELGNKCIGAKVNGKVVPLNYKLKSGERIEILTSKNQKPHSDWLKFVVTTKARTVILKYLKDGARKTISSGKLIWNDFISTFEQKLQQKNFSWLISNLNFSDETEFYKALAENEIELEYIREQLLKKIEKEKKPVLSEVVDAKPDLPVCELKELDLPVEFAMCCMPVRGDKITSLIVDGKTIHIHRSECKKYYEFNGRQNLSLIHVEWSSVSHTEFQTKIHVVADDEPNTLSNITSAIVKDKSISFKAINFDTKDTDFAGTITLFVQNTVQLDNCMEEIRKINNVRTVERIS